MKIAPPPLRCLMLTIGGWACMRAMIFDPEPPSGRLVSSVTAAAAVSSRPVRAPPLKNRRRRPSRASLRGFTPEGHAEHRGRRPTAPAAFAHSNGSPPTITSPSSNVAQIYRSDLAPFRPQAILRPDDRWSGSVWIFVRRGGGPELAAGGVLGGSQAGGRLTYRLNRDAARPVSATGLARLDVGPHLSARLPGSDLRLSADWRVRVAGDAAPASRPALTLSADF